MRYMLAIYLDEPETAKRTDAEVTADMASHAPYIEMLKANSKLASCDPLWPSSSARTLTTTNGKIVVTAGPFAESREQFGGYYVIDAKDLDEALELAAQCPALRTPGVIGVEIRPIVKYVAAADAQAPAQETRFFVAVYCPGDREESPRSHATLLAPASSATTLRWHDGRIDLGDGAFYEGERELREYWVVSAQSLTDAVALTFPSGVDETIEIRPIRAGGA